MLFRYHGNRLFNPFVLVPRVHVRYLQAIVFLALLTGDIILGEDHECVRRVGNVLSRNDRATCGRFLPVQSNPVRRYVSFDLASYVVAVRIATLVSFRFYLH